MEAGSRAASQILSGQSHTLHALICCGLLQDEKKNTDVFVQQIDGIAGELSELLFDGCRLVVPQACFRLGLMEGPSHELDFVTNVGNDRTQLLSMGQKALDATFWQELTVQADRGYYNGEEVLACEGTGVLPSTGTTGHWRGVLIHAVVRADKSVAAQSLHRVNGIAGGILGSCGKQRIAVAQDLLTQGRMWQNRLVCRSSSIRSPVLEICSTYYQSMP